jgi:hypothetical protein
VLFAFINPSGPTRELQKLAVLLRSIVLILGSFGAHFGFSAASTERARYDEVLGMPSVESGR